MVTVQTPLWTVTGEYLNSAYGFPGELKSQAVFSIILLYGYTHNRKYLPDNRLYDRMLLQRGTGKGRPMCLVQLERKAVEPCQHPRKGGDEVVQVIAFLKDIRLSKEKDAGDGRAMRGLEVLKSFAGILPEDFDYEKELAEAREEKYGRTD